MGFLGGRNKGFEVRPEQKWDYISLNDFKSSSCWAPFAYGYLYFSLILSIAVYGVDTFTAINLLVFGQWSSSIEPTSVISFDVAKYIFSICIIASFVNLGFEHIRAMRIMKRGSVAECFLDSLAVRLESVRFGSGQGWRRFLVFAELTKSKKGAEYIALFTYFSFQSWIRVIFCSGPRQVVNGLTLYAVYSSKLIVSESGPVDATLANFFRKIQSLAQENAQQAVILSGMLFTLIIWVFAALSLLLAALFYVLFLWHHIPSQDGGLSGYCERKVNKRLMSIVSKKVNKAIAKEERDRMRAEIKAAKKAGLAGEKPAFGRQATLPTLMGEGNTDKLPEMPMLSRNDTMATLPLYTSRPGTPGSIEMSAFDQKRPLPSRQGTTTTMASQTSYSSRAPLMGQASAMGMDRSASPAPSFPRSDLNNYPPTRPGTAQSSRSYGQAPSLHRVQTSGSSGLGASYTSSPSTYSPDTLPSMPTLPSIPPSIRSPVGSMDSYNRPMPRAVNQLGGRSGPSGPPNGAMFDDMRGGRASPAPSNYSESQYSGRGTPVSRPAQGYNGPSYSPYRSASANPEFDGRRPQQAPQRNMTAPMPQRQQASDDYFNRPGTASSQRGPPRSDYGYNNDVESQRGPPRY